MKTLHDNICFRIFDAASVATMQYLMEFHCFFSSPRYHDFIWLRISSIPIMTASSLRKSSTFVAESSHVLLPVLTLFRLSIRSVPFEVLSRMELDWSVLMREDSFAGEFLISSDGPCSVVCSATRQPAGGVVSRNLVSV